MQHKQSDYDPAKDSTRNVTHEMRQISPEHATEAATTLINIQHPDNLIDTLNEMWEGYIGSPLCGTGTTIERHKRNYNAIRLHLQQISNSMLRQNFNNLQNSTTMEQLIPINENNGQQIVNARDLHEYLEVNSRYNDWIKNRIDKYGFVENQDYITLTKNLVNGGAQKDHGLTIDMAKELSMVENNEKGKKARKYFIAVENAAKRQPQTQLTATEALLQSVQIMVEQEKKIIAIDNRLSKLEEVRQTNIEELNLIPMSLNTAPELSTKDNVRLLVNKYANASGLSQLEIWNKLYSDMYYRYHINVKGYKKIKSSESWLDVAERKGFIEQMYILVSEYSKKFTA